MTDRRSPFGIAPPAIPLVLALLAVPQGAQARDMAEIGLVHCLAPMVQGVALDFNGLQETTAEAHGLTPEPPLGERAPKYYLDAESGVVVGAFEAWTLRACIVIAPDAQAELPEAAFDALLAASDMIAPPECRAIAVDTDDGPAEVTLGFSRNRTSAGRFINASYTRVLGTEATDLMVWETTERTDPVDCGRGP